MADMMVLNSRTNCGPIRLSGGLSNVIRQYAGDVRLILICAALVTVLITTSSRRGPHYTLALHRTARGKSIGRWYRAWRGSARGRSVSPQGSAPALRAAQTCAA